MVLDLKLVVLAEVEAGSLLKSSNKFVLHLAQCNVGKQLNIILQFFLHHIFYNFSRTLIKASCEEHSF